MHITATNESRIESTHLEFTRGHRIPWEDALQQHRVEISIPTSLRRYIVEETTAAIAALKSGDSYSGLEQTTRYQDTFFGATIEAQRNEGLCSAHLVISIKKKDGTLISNKEILLFKEVGQGSLREAEDYTSLMVPPTMAMPEDHIYSANRVNKGSSYQYSSAR